MPKKVEAQSADFLRRVDEVEEDELPHVPPSHHAPGQSPPLAALLAGLEALGLDPNRGDFLAIGKAFRQ
jgi:hypothetical protein